jgi:hypothetical protein
MDLRPYGYTFGDTLDHMGGSDLGMRLPLTLPLDCES